VGEGVKRAPADELTHDSKKQRTDVEVDLAKVKRQVEYYFSNENLQYDRFFNPIIKNNPEGWLPVANILSCKKIQALNAGCSDIVAALEDSELEVKELESGWSVRRLSAIPELKDRPERQEKPKNYRRVHDIHCAGCVIKINNIPEEASWQTVKEKIISSIPAIPPNPQSQADIDAGKTPFIPKAIQFISNPSPQGTSFAFASVFPDDRNFFMNFPKLEINGAEIQVSLATELDEINKFCDKLPQAIKKRREREIERQRRLINSRPIIVEGFEFSSIDHLKKCLKEILTELPAGKTVNSKTQTVLQGLLAYHPNGKTKMENCVAMKVDIVENEGGQGKPTRCFFVVKEDGSTDDFSIQKCFNFMSLDPPFKPQETTQAPGVGPPAQAGDISPASVDETVKAEQVAEPVSTGEGSTGEAVTPDAPVVA